MLCKEWFNRKFNNNRGHMNIFLSFAPWIAMFICAAMGKSMAFYAGTSLVIQLLVICKESFRAKFLDYCSLCFFILLLLMSQSSYSVWVNQYLSYLSHAYLALVVLKKLLQRANGIRHCFIRLIYS